MASQRIDSGRSWEAFGPYWAKTLGKRSEGDGERREARGKEKDAKGVLGTFKSWGRGGSGALKASEQPTSLICFKMASKKTKLKSAVKSQAGFRLIEQL